MEESSLNFEQILKEVQKSKVPIRISPWLALNYLNVTRRGWRVNERVNKMLDDYDVMCEPSFSNAWIYGQVEIKAKPKVLAHKSSSIEESDPTPRLSLLKAANLNNVKEGNQGIGLIFINRNTKLSEAITIMLMHDFSQLPILSSPREVDGIISWRSIGRSLALGVECVSVADCMEEVAILSFDEPLFKAVKIILENEVVLVKQKDKLISGIVTITDIGDQFIALAEPFLIIEQIENHIRRIMDGKFSIEEVRTSIDPSDAERVINSLADLSFGEYLRIIENPDKFSKLDLRIDRGIIIKYLEEVRKIRNDVMHFDPDGITSMALERLRQTAHFFHTVASTLKKKK